MIVALFALAAALRAAEGRLQPSSGRHLLQRQPTTAVFMGNFTAFDDDAFDCTANITRCPVGVGKAIPEYRLDVPANVTVDSSAPSLYGSHELSGPQVQEFFDLLDRQLTRVPPREARTFVASPPGEVIYGKSVAESTDPSRIQRRLPTIFSPLHMGHKFRLETIETPQSTQHTILFIRNITLVMPESTFSNLSLADWFEIGTQSLTRVCFGNTVLLLKSCDGFEQAQRGDEQVELFCCLLRDCISYRQQQVIQLGFPVGQLDPLQCYGAEDPEPSSGDRKERITIAVLASAAAFVLVLLFVLIALHRHRKGQRAALEKEEAMRRQMSTYQEQLEREKEQSKNEKAELQKMRAQYKMLAMDLLANTGASDGKKGGERAERSRERDGGERDRERDRDAERKPKAKAAAAADKEPKLLTVIDQNEEQNAKSIQKQLRSVLHAADERTPVSVQAEIGRGAFGVVYRGIWKNIQVAIKTVLFQANGDIHSDPVLREAMLALRIAHPNLVATYRANVRMLEDAGLQTAGSPGNIQFKGDITPSYQLFLLQEYCDSGTLYDWLSRERMHPGNVPDKAVIVRCALDISRGVQHLHHSEIIHGDLKPQNIMLTTVPETVRAESGTPSPPSFPYAAKLTDFGLSFQMDRNKSHMSNMRIGTPFYFAPEVQGKGYLSKAADMYSFGVLLWEMFHGMPPYAADNGHLVNNASFPRFDLRHREDAPFSYVCIALACLSTDYEKRPNIDDVVTVLEDLNECLNGSPDASMLMRNASLKRVTKGSYKAGFAAPASLVKQVNAAPAPTRSASSSSKKRPQNANVSQIILKMLGDSGLHRDSDLRKRLDVTDAAELERLAGVSSKRVQNRCLRDGRGAHVGNVHLNSQWMFDVLPPSSLADDRAPRPAPQTPSKH